MEDFIRECERLMDGKLMASPADKSIYTLSNGQKVRLIPIGKTRYEVVKGGKVKLVEYTISKAEVIR